MLSLINALGLLVLYWVGLAVYRLYLSPLAHVPGPKIAALTDWYCTYHDFIRGGQYIWVIRDMHAKYGPVVRIRPGIVHINDPAFIDKLYTQSPTHVRERAQNVIDFSVDARSMLFTKDHNLHRRRRAALSRFFSQQNVRRLVPVINETATDLFDRMDGWAKEGKPVCLSAAFKAATKDVIQGYALGDGRKCLQMEDLNAPFFEVLQPRRGCHMTTHFHTFSVLMAKLPPPILVKLMPAVAAFIDFDNDLASQIDKIKAEKDQPESSTIFHEVLKSDLPDSEKETRRLVDEAQVLTIAGADTTAHIMTCLAFKILDDRDIFRRLRAELDSVMPDPMQMPDPAKLDSLPFLNALIEEAIRFYPSATLRQDRVAPDEDLVYQYSDGRSLLLPAGSIMGMTAPLLNRSPYWYETDADVFNPDRFIENPKLMRRTMTFSKGARQCIGINLAYQELQSFFALIFRRYSPYDPSKKQQDGPTMELYKTTHKEIEMYADYITMDPYPGSPGLRVIIRKD